MIGVCDSQTGAKSLCVLTGIAKESDVEKCVDEIAPLFVTDSVSDVRDILVFGEDMTNEDEEKQAIAELERLKQERREMKRKQREERRKIKEQREKEIEEGKQMMREELERMEKEEREKGGNHDGNHNETNNDTQHNQIQSEQPKQTMNSDHNTATQETLVTEEDLKK